MGDEPADNEQSVSVLPWMGRHSKELITVIAAVATAWFALTNSVFYGKLGVALRDVGIGPAELLSQAAVGVTTATAALALVATVFARLYARGRRWQGTERDWHAAMVAAAVGAVALTFEAVVLAWIRPRWSAPQPVVYGTWAIVVGIVVVSVFRQGKRERATYASRIRLTVSAWLSPSPLRSSSPSPSSRWRLPSRMPPRCAMAQRRGACSTRWPGARRDAWE